MWNVRLLLWVYVDGCAILIMALSRYLRVARRISLRDCADRLKEVRAHRALLGFLQRAHHEGLTFVLVITGKGSSSGGDGVLRRAVPAWLSTPAFRPLVSSHDHAARNHGGAGALYIRLRRARS